MVRKRVEQKNSARYTFGIWLMLFFYVSLVAPVVNRCGAIACNLWYHLRCQHIGIIGKQFCIICSQIFQDNFGNLRFHFDGIITYNYLYTNLPVLDCPRCDLSRCSRIKFEWTAVSVMPQRFALRLNFLASCGESQNCFLILRCMIFFLSLRGIRGAGLRWRPPRKAQKHRPRRQPRPP